MGEFTVCMYVRTCIFYVCMYVYMCIEYDGAVGESDAEVLFELEPGPTQTQTTE